MQRICAFLLVLALSPFILFVMLLILVIERENPVFIQERIGYKKDPFLVYKLRTMKDGGITKIGRVLRKSGIDELPQLFNIAMGEMNFVGPRPLTQADIDRLQWNSDFHDKRWSVRPGITGMAQLVNVCDADISLKNDFEYIAKRSWWLDLKLLFRSALVPLIGKTKTKKLIHSN